MERWTKDELIGQYQGQIEYDKQEIAALRKAIDDFFGADLPYQFEDVLRRFPDRGRGMSLPVDRRKE